MKTNPKPPGRPTSRDRKRDAENRSKLPEPRVMWAYTNGYSSIESPTDEKIKPWDIQLAVIPVHTKPTKAKLRAIQRLMNGADCDDTRLLCDDLEFHAQAIADLCEDDTTRTIGKLMVRAADYINRLLPTPTGRRKGKK